MITVSGATGSGAGLQHRGQSASQLHLRLGKCLAGIEEGKDRVLQGVFAYCQVERIALGVSEPKQEPFAYRC